RLCLGCHHGPWTRWRPCSPTGRLGPSGCLPFLLHPRLFERFPTSLHGLPIHLRSQRRVDFRHHHRALRVEGLVHVHSERDRSARDQRQVHVLPVLIGGVFHQCPALQERGLSI